MEQIEALAQPERESMIERLSRQKIVHNCKICPNINDEQQNWYQQIQIAGKQKKSEQSMVMKKQKNEIKNKKEVDRI